MLMNQLKIRKVFTINIIKTLKWLIEFFRNFHFAIDIRFILIYTIIKE